MNIHQKTGSMNAYGPVKNYCNLYANIIYLPTDLN